MGAFLERLSPLVSLLCDLPDPGGACAHMRAAAEQGNKEALVSAVGGGIHTEPNLRHAGILDAHGVLTDAAREQLIRLEAVVADRTLHADRWKQVVTVPDYLRNDLPFGEVQETERVVTGLVSGAHRRVIMASPFLDDGFDALVPHISRLLSGGGTFLLLTRELERSASRNFAVVQKLREVCGDPPGLQIVSWEDKGLGLHMKSIVADSERAYVGSANFTTGGFGRHAELGVLLEGPSVRGVERVLETLAAQMRSRGRPRPSR